MEPILSVIRPWVKDAGILVLLLSASCAGVPHQEHYMLRSDFYRQLEESRKLGESEKNALMERIAGLQATNAREEGVRLQLTREAELQTERATEAEKRAAVIVAESEKLMKAAREDNEFLTARVQGFEKELAVVKRDYEARLAEHKTELDELRLILRKYDEMKETSALVADDILFASGSAVLSSDAKTRIKEHAEKYPSAEFISVVGYTDDREIRGPLFPSNWALAASRAAAVTDFIVTEYKVPANRITLVGRGELDPKYPNDTQENRRLNRRVEIIAVERPKPQAIPQ